VPSGLIEQKHGMGARRDLRGDLGEVQVHRLGVAAGHDECRTLAVLRADGSEYISRGGALIGRRRGPCAAFGPASGGLVLLPDAGLVGKPDF
jgi:hypothetical protein